MAGVLRTCNLNLDSAIEMEWMEDGIHIQAFSFTLLAITMFCFKLISISIFLYFFLVKQESDKRVFSTGGGEVEDVVR